MYQTAQNLQPAPRRYEAVLALLAESGYRANAIENAKLFDVWDPHHRVILDVISLEEKNSKVRKNKPNERLRRALQQYVEYERSVIASEWLFPNSVYPQLRSKVIAAHVISRLSNESGIHSISPNPIRRYVVNKAMRNGLNLEQVSKWLGHSTCSTTSRYYWTDDVLSIEVLRSNQATLSSNDDHKNRIIKEASEKIDQLLKLSVTAI